MHTEWCFQKNNKNLNFLNREDNWVIGEREKRSQIISHISERYLPHKRTTERVGVGIGLILVLTMVN